MGRGSGGGGRRGAAGGTPEARAEARALRELRAFDDNVRLARLTVNDPDATPAQRRAAQRLIDSQALTRGRLQNNVARAAGASIVAGVTRMQAAYEAVETASRELSIAQRGVDESRVMLREARRGGVLGATTVPRAQDQLARAQNRLRIARKNLTLAQREEERLLR